MRGPVSGEAHADHAVQRHRSAVHNRFTQLVIFQILDQLRCGLNDGAQQRLTEPILQQRVTVGMEVMLKGMRHNVDHAIDRLVSRQGEGVHRIKNGERRISMHAAPAHFFFGHFICDNGAVVHF
ncbi:hypothetical protein D3C73_1193200 [compost metagenome]